MAVPKRSFVFISFGNKVFFISAIDVPSGDRSTAWDASAAFLGRHLVSLKVPVGEPGTSLDDLGTLGCFWQPLEGLVVKK